MSLGPVSGDGTKIHADASKHAAVSYEHAIKILADLRTQVRELNSLAMQAATAPLPPGMDVAAEIQLRLDRIDRLEEAIQVIEERARVRYDQEQAVYDAQLAARTERARMTGKTPRGKPPTPPTPGPRPKDQYNFTDAASRIMKNSTDTGVNQHYNAQLAVDQGLRFIVGCDVSDQPNDMHQAVPVIQSIPHECGQPTMAVFDAGYRSEANVLALEEMAITPLMAPSKRDHGLHWRTWFAQHPDTPPPAGASALARMEYTVTTVEGDRIYRQRKSTVEPVIGIIKEGLGFRQFSVRGLEKVRAEWRLVCSAYNVKRLLKLLAAPRAQQAVSQATTAVIDAVVSAFNAAGGQSQRRNTQCQRHWTITISRCTTLACLAANNRSRRPQPTGC
jgi:hypothetical protein